MTRRFFRLLKWLAIVALISLVSVLAVRAWDAHRSPPLKPWHTFVPEELSASAIAKAGWTDYLAAEQKLFDSVRTNVSDKLDPEDRYPGNRYWVESPIYPGKFKTDWNRSYVMEPDGTPAGAVVLLHGLTDSPYSLRHVARRYRNDGFAVVAIRLPGHGTVPSGLAEVEWEQWMEATRLAAREARRVAGPATPLHVIGFSNGGALAVKYAMDALEDKALARPDRIVLVSPMIGITELARFAGVFGWPAVFPAFAKAAWLGVVPEFNPFKYNSFPVNGARQSSLVARRLQQQVDEHARAGRLATIAPILTFQSVVDFTVSTRAIIDALYSRLPANGSELVLFDLNRSAKFGPLLRTSTDHIVSRLLPNPPRTFRTTVITNAGPGNPEVVERVTEAAAIGESVRPLGIPYPPEVFSLSHLALPFPLSDSLYGMRPDATEEFFGVHLGEVATRGERGALIVSLDSLARMSSNPFFAYMMERIEEGLPGRPPRK